MISRTLRLALSLLLWCLVMPRRKSQSGAEIKEFSNLNTQSSGLRNILSPPERAQEEEESFFAVDKMRC